MKLLIISHTAHYLDEGKIVGWGATVREIKELAYLFDEVSHIAPLHQEPTPESSLPYNVNVRLIPVSPSGGDRVANKLDILRKIPQYTRVFISEVSKADVIHVRCPSNISLIVIVLLAFLRRPKKRWVKYAGNWKPTGKEAWSYRFQRWWLRNNFSRSMVTVNGQWDDSPPHVHAFRNPCLTEQELNEGEEAARTKSLTGVMRFVFVGRLDGPKGAGYALKVIEHLRGKEYVARLDIVGDGPDRKRFEEVAEACGIREYVHFHGWKLRSEINQYYRDAHFILLPSSSEGWPKVLSEAMAYGVVPLASNVSSIPQFLEGFRTGRYLSPDDVVGYVEAVEAYHDDPESWKQESIRSVAASKAFSYRSYIEDVRRLLDLE